LRVQSRKNGSNETLIRPPTDERALISPGVLPDVGERKELSHLPTSVAAPPPAQARSSPARYEFAPFLVCSHLATSAPQQKAVDVDFRGRGGGPLPAPLMAIPELDERSKRSYARCTSGSAVRVAPRMDLLNLGEIEMGEGGKGQHQFAPCAIA